MASKLRNRPSKRPLRGVPVRRIDHVNLMVNDVVGNTDFAVNTLGFKLREQKIGDGGAVVGSWLSVSALVHELALMRDSSRRAGALPSCCISGMAIHNTCSTSRISSPSATSILKRSCQTWHTQAYFLYCFEPGGNRVELFGDTGYLIFDPDWKTVVWNVANADRSWKKAASGLEAILAKSFYRYGTPVVPGHSLEEIGRYDPTC